MNRNSQVIIDSIMTYRAHLARFLGDDNAIRNEGSLELADSIRTSSNSGSASDVLLDFAVDICSKLLPQSKIDLNDLRRNLPVELSYRRGDDSIQLLRVPKQIDAASETAPHSFNEVYLQRQGGILERIAGGDSIGSILDELVTIVEEQLRGTFCSILMLSSDGQSLHVASARSLPKQYNDKIEGVRIGPNVGSCGTAAFTQCPVFVSDIEHDPLWSEYRELALQYGLRSCWSVPIMSRTASGETDGVIGTFALYTKQIGVPDAASEQLIARAERLASVAIKADRSYRALRESEARLAEAQQIGRIGSFEIDMITWKGQCSPALNSIFGFSDTDGYQKLLLFLASHSPDDDFAQGSTSIDFEIADEQEYTYSHPNGQDRHICIRRRAIRDQQGAVIKVVGTAQDITERRKTEDSLRLLQAQLQHALKMEAVGRLAGGVAHDFNNLLTVINGYCEILIGKLNADDAVLESVLAIRDAGARAARLTEQLLAFSRKAVYKPQILDLNDIISSMGVLLGRLIGEDVHLSMNLDPNSPAIVADPGHIEQVLMNLAINARDAMPKGGFLKISTRGFLKLPLAERQKTDLPPGNYLELKIEDSGCGIPVDLQQKIFEPFFTTKDSSKGSGLGLAVVHGIVTQIGGTIEIESSAGDGAIFRIYFPASISEFVQSKVTLSETNITGSETILIVEDEDAVRSIARISLEAQGYKVLEASDSNEAIQMFELHGSEIKMLVTDIVLPEIGGCELAATIRENCPQLPVLFTSGQKMEILDKIEMIPSDKILNKPFLPQELAQRVREILDHIPD